MSLHDQVLAVRMDLRGCLLERETAIDNALLALLTGEHYCMFGPPGTGKSMLVRAVAARLTGATYFEKAMSPVTTPEDIYGPIDLIRLSEHGEWVRRDVGSMSRAHVVFLDEVTRSNEAIRDTLLVAMNERLAQVVGFDPYPLPLLSLFSAANHPFDEESGAFNDRFLLREMICPLKEPQNFMALLTGQLPDWRTVNASISLEELRQAQFECSAVKGTAEVAAAVLALQQRLSSEGVYVSDRRWAQCGKLLKARAWLDGLQEMDLDSMTCLVHALWQDPKEAKVVERAVYEVAAPLHLKAIEVEDTIAEIVQALPDPSGRDYRQKAENVLQAAVDAHTELRRAIQASNARDKERAVAALATIERQHKAISTNLFKEMSRLSL